MRDRNKDHDLVVRYFSMAFEAQPLNFERFVVIVVVSLGIWISAILAWLSLQAAISYGISNLHVGLVFFGITCTMLFLYIVHVIPSV